MKKYLSFVLAFLAIIALFFCLRNTALQPIKEDIHTSDVIKKIEDAFKISLETENDCHWQKSTIDTAGKTLNEYVYAIIDENGILDSLEIRVSYGKFQDCDEFYAEVTDCFTKTIKAVFSEPNNIAYADKFLAKNWPKTKTRNTADIQAKTTVGDYTVVLWAKSGGNEQYSSFKLYILHDRDFIFAEHI